MNRKGLIAKISNKYVLPTCIWKYFLQSSRYFAFFGEFRGSATARNIRSPEWRKVIPLKDSSLNTFFTQHLVTSRQFRLSLFQTVLSYPHQVFCNTKHVPVTNNNPQVRYHYHTPYYSPPIPFQGLFCTFCNKQLIFCAS